MDNTLSILVGVWIVNSLLITALLALAIKRIIADD